MSEPVYDLEPGQSVVAKEYAPYFLSLIANRFSWGASQLFLDLFDIGLNEWRILSALRNEPGATASRIVEMVILNKSVVSRSARTLHRKGMAAEILNDGRREWWLTAAGVAMHDRIIAIALEREEQLLAGLDPAERATLFALLERLAANLPRVEALDMRLHGGGELK